MSDQPVPPVLIPKIIPPHPRFPGRHASEQKEGREKPEKRPEVVQAAQRVEQTEQAVVTELTEELGIGVLFSENMEGGVAFAGPESRENPERIFAEPKEPKEAEEAEEAEGANGEGPVESKAKAEVPEKEEAPTVAKQPESETKKEVESPEVAIKPAAKTESSEASEPKGSQTPDEVKGAEGENNGSEDLDGEVPAGRRKLSWLKRQRKPKPRPVAISGEASPFNGERAAPRKKGFWARMKERERGGEEKPADDGYSAEKNGGGPAIESWVDGVDDELELWDTSELGPLGSDGPTVRASEPVEEAGGTPSPSPRRPLSATRRHLVATIGLASALACGAWVFWQYDSDAPNDSDLVPVVTETARHNPVHTQLSHFLMRFRFDDKFAGMSGWKDYDTDTLAELLRKNGSALELILSCLAEKDWRTQHPAWRESNLGDDLPWADLARVKQAEALYLQRRGLEVGAFRAAFDLMEFGRNIQEVEAWPNYFLTGLDIYHRGLETVEQLVANTRMDSAQLGALQRTFTAHHPPGEADLMTFYRASYGLEKAILEGNEAPARPGSFSFHIARPDGLLFKKNRTLTLFAEAFVGMIADSSKPHFERNPPDLTTSESASVLDSNRTGRLYFAKAMKPYLEIPEKQALSVAHHDAVTTLFALRRHGLDLGRLPDTLADLGVTYLKKVPNDPFDGKSLRYSRYRKVVYSAGVDGVDDGGVPGRAGFLNRAEPTLEIPFSTGGDGEFH